MAEPKAKPAGGLLKKLSPKQKRYAAVIGGGALLALVYLIMRNRSAPLEGATPSSTEGAVESAPIPAVGGGGATDPSAFLGAQGESITERLGEVGAGLNEVGAGLGEVGRGQDSLSEGLGTMGEAARDFQSSQEQANARTAESLNHQNRQLAAIREKLKGNGSSKSGSKGSGSGGTAAPKNNPPGKPKNNPPGKPKNNPPSKPAPKAAVGGARAVAPPKKKK
jgi:hypothetical protein